MSQNYNYGNESEIHAFVNKYKVNVKIYYTDYEFINKYGESFDIYYLKLQLSGVLDNGHYNVIREIYIIKIFVIVIVI